MNRRRRRFMTRCNESSHVGPTTNFIILIFTLKVKNYKGLTPIIWSKTAITILQFFLNLDIFRCGPLILYNVSDLPNLSIVLMFQKHIECFILIGTRSKPWCGLIKIALTTEKLTICLVLHKHLRLGVVFVLKSSSLTFARPARP